MKMIYPTKDCKYDVGVFCNNFHEIEAELVRMNEIISDGRSGIVNKSTGETIVATDSAKAGFEGLRIFGRSEQGSTTGKNLLKNNGETQTRTGVTFTVNEDGSITVKGTATANTTFSVQGSSKNYSLELASGDYILNGCEDGSSSTYFLKLRSAATNTVANSMTGDSVFTHDGSALWCYIYVYSGVTVDTIIKPMIRLASITDDSWEPYTGGIASPNPEYPQEIVGVGDGGSVEVSVFGKNLVSAEYGSDNKDYGRLVSSSDLKAIKKGEIYTASVVLEASATTKAYWNGSSGIYPTTGFNVNTGKAKYTLTFEAISDGVLLNGNITMLTKSATGDGVTITASDFQIENGETATEYEPHQKQSAIFTTSINEPRAYYIHI